MYIELEFIVTPLQPATEILIAELAELGFESFVETEDGLQAYIPERNWNKELLQGIRILQQQGSKIEYTIRHIEKQNWNARWEKGFSPIKVGADCQVRAPFHKAEAVTFDIVIEPKMSFGTGHHETTYLMLENLLGMDVAGMSVLDMGCGTGVLAILAAMKGAKTVDAIDVDPWSYTNTLENVERNNQLQIRVLQGDAGVLEEDAYNLILANINKNILLEDIPLYAKSLTHNGVLLVSGFYLDDLVDISEICAGVNLKFEKNRQKNDWISAKYVF